MLRRKQDDQGKPKRRTRGEGSVVRRADGRYVARVPLGGGKRKEEYYDTQQEAERAKRRMLNERDVDTLAGLWSCQGPAHFVLFDNDIE